MSDQEYNSAYQDGFNAGWLQAVADYQAKFRAMAEEDGYANVAALNVLTHVMAVRILEKIDGAQSRNGRYWEPEGGRDDCTE